MASDFQKFAQSKTGISKGRTKLESNFKADIIKKAEGIFDEFKNYTDGYRLLFLIHRNKEGGETNNTKHLKVITTGSEDFFEELVKMVDYKDRNSEIPYRIYSSLNSRNIEKAVKQFKYEQLDADYYGDEQKWDFYLNIKNRWIGCMMQPQQRETSFFLFDVDNVEGRDVHGDTLQVIPSEYIIKSYATKNGWHIITVPHNHTTYTLPEGVEMKKDGLLLLNW